MICLMNRCSSDTCHCCWSIGFKRFCAIIGFGKAPNSIDATENWNWKTERKNFSRWENRMHTLDHVCFVSLSLHRWQSRYSFFKSSKDNEAFVWNYGEIYVHIGVLIGFSGHKCKNSFPLFQTLQKLKASLKTQKKTLHNKSIGAKLQFLKKLTKYLPKHFLYKSHLKLKILSATAAIGFRKKILPSQAES